LQDAKGPASDSSGTVTQGGKSLSTRKGSAKTEGRSVPTHERIRLDAAAHPERSYREHIEASREIAGEQYREDLRRIAERERANRGDR